VERDVSVRVMVYRLVSIKRDVRARSAPAAHCGLGANVATCASDRITDVRSVTVYETLDDMPHFETSFVTRARAGEPWTLRARVDTRHADTAKDKTTGRPVPGSAHAQFPSVRRPIPALWWCSLTIAHTSPSPRVPNYTLAHIHKHERTAQAIVSGEGQFAVRTRARSHTLRLTAREQTPDRPTWQWWYPSSQRERPVCQSRVRGDV